MGMGMLGTLMPLLIYEYADSLTTLLIYECADSLMTFLIYQYVDVLTPLMLMRISFFMCTVIVYISLNIFLIVKIIS